MTKQILISAGHTNIAGSDQGVANRRHIEGREAVRVRDTVAAKLRELGRVVVEDGADGINDPLKKALQLARGSAIAVEIHFNAAANPKATGIEVLAFLKHRPLAQAIAKNIAKATGIVLRGDRGYKPHNSGQHHRLAFCQVGGLIVEICFLTNPSDMDLYEEHFAAMCDGIAAAIAAATS